MRKNRLGLWQVERQGVLCWNCNSPIHPASFSWRPFTKYGLGDKTCYDCAPKSEHKFHFILKMKE